MLTKWFFATETSEVNQEATREGVEEEIGRPKGRTNRGAAYRAYIKMGKYTCQINEGPSFLHSLPPSQPGKSALGGTA